LRNNGLSWESLRPCDGSLIKISFDWNDDHSAWRFEELSNEINEAIEILTSSGLVVQRPSNIYELGPIASLLRNLHRGKAISDSMVRRALKLADELELGDIYNDDASFEYDCLIERVDEYLEAWDEYNTWIFIQDEWDVSAKKLFDRCREQRNGLGDRWSITLDDDRIELPDGTEVFGLRPMPHQSKLFDEIVIDLAYVDEEDNAGLAKAVMNLELKTANLVAQAICELAAGRKMKIDADTANKIIDIVHRHDADELAKVIDTAARLATHWSGSESELIIASEALLVN
jgi:hypothetical protein